jgi:hypothetical protein
VEVTTPTTQGPTTAQLPSQSTAEAEIAEGTKSGSPTSNLTPGTTPSLTERIGDVLYILGINGTNTNAIANLLAQSNFEFPSGPVGNNLFGTTLQVGNSTSINSDGVQSYSTWQDGVYAAAAMFAQSNNQAAYTALAQNVDINGYATALGNSSWEGDNGTAATKAANVSYGQSVLARYNSILNTIKSDITGYQGEPGNPTDSSGGAANAESDGLPTTAGILSFLGVPDFSWTVVGSIVLGIALVILGVIFILHKDVGGAAKALALG